MRLNDRKNFGTYDLALSCTEGRLDDDVGTFMVSAVLTSSSQNRYMTVKEKVEAFEFVVDGLSKHLEECKKEALVRKLSGVNDE